jgi:hypothetical protein
VMSERQADPALEERPRICQVRASLLLQPCVQAKPTRQILFVCHCIAFLSDVAGKAVSSWACSDWCHAATVLQYHASLPQKHQLPDQHGSADKFYCYDFTPQTELVDRATDE